MKKIFLISSNDRHTIDLILALVFCRQLTYEREWGVGSGQRLAYILHQATRSRGYTGKTRLRGLKTLI
ncbi:MAG: hypothetical protein V7K50_01140 [Nostoc sp.]|uniref:hypothetical protein n=1 Tax=Nostoc sp. TaxID=1180 RepID=UPI002FF44ECF